MKTFFAMLSGLFLGAAAVAQPSNDALRAFHDMVQTGDLDDVQAALKANPALAAAADSYGFQATDMLDYAGFDAKLALLMRHGADVNAQNGDGHGLLHVVIDPEFVPAVVRAGGDLELRDSKGRTPLMLALTEPDSYDMVQALLDAGADANARDDGGRSALAYGESIGAADDVLALLRDAGARM